MWTYVHDTPGAVIPTLCHKHIQYLRRLRDAWTDPVVPKSWIDPGPGDDAFVKRDRQWLINTTAIRMHLAPLRRKIATVTTENIAECSSSPADPGPDFCATAERHRFNVDVYMNYQSEGKIGCTQNRMWMSLCQVVQFFHYRRNERQAEYAIANALDGIPGAYVRRRDLTVWNLNDSGPHAAHFLDCALLLALFAPAAESESLDFMVKLPISIVNPALLLCMKGVANWYEDATHDRTLDDVIKSMSAEAEISLVALVATWCLRIQQGLKYPDVFSHAADDQEDPEDLPGWALLLGMIYDAEVIHVIAHIPYKAEDGSGYRYLSVLFAALPFPSDCRGDVAEYTLARYKVAYAMLCIQHHIARLTTIWEQVSWSSWKAADDEDEKGGTIPTPIVTTWPRLVETSEMISVYQRVQSMVSLPSPPPTPELSPVRSVRNEFPEQRPNFKSREGFEASEDDDNDDDDDDDDENYEDDDDDENEKYENDNDNENKNHEDNNDNNNENHEDNNDNNNENHEDDYEEIHSIIAGFSTWGNEAITKWSAGL
ncbi:predicted protein [Postia placenta Mad-698-R]|nr:predicted protein [Postia placenta Mad-698-R]